MKISYEDARRQRVQTLLDENPEKKYVVVVMNDPDDDPVPVAIGIRGQATFEVLIPRSKYDPFMLLDLVAKHGGTMQ